jgi:hypothetical protein
LLASPDTALDLASLAYSISTGDAAGAALDVFSLIVPGLTGLSTLNRAGNALQTVNRLDIFGPAADALRHGGDYLHAVSQLDITGDAGRVANTVSNVSYTTRYGDDVAQGFSSACRFNSFSADTEVATDEGDQPISQIQIGDYVLAWDEETNTISFYPITDTIHHTDAVIVHPSASAMTISGWVWAASSRKSKIPSIALQFSIPTHIRKPPPTVPLPSRFARRTFCF